MFGRIIRVVLWAILISIFVRVLLVDTFSVKGDSMSPTIKDGNYVVINRLAYIFNEPKRGDIIVAYPRDSMQKILKRVVGLPGEIIDFEKDKIVIRKERGDTGEIIEEIYLGDGNVTKGNQETLRETVDPYEYFILGDNRDVSVDSRSLGLVDGWDIKGKVIYIFDL